MKIVLDEIAYAEKILETKEPTGPKYETLVMVAKYYAANHYSKPDARRMLDILFAQCWPDENIHTYSNVIDNAIKNGFKYPAVRIDGISISKEELERIKAAGTSQYVRCLAFTLLCLAKYYMLKRDGANGWVGTKDSEIMAMANVTVSVKRQSELFAKLHGAGMIEYSKRIENLGVRVLYVEPGEEDMFVSDFRNLGYQYLLHYGGRFFECESCGITERDENKGRGRRKRFCPDCAYQIHTRQKIESVMRGRAMQQKGK